MGPVKNRTLFDLRVCTLAVAAAFATLPSAAQTVAPSSDLGRAVAEATTLVRQAAMALAPPGAKVLASPGALDPRLQLAPCQQISPYLSAGVPAWGRTRVGLRCTAGAAWNVSLPVQIQVWAPAWVASAALPAGAELQTGQLQLAPVDWAASPKAPLAATVDLSARVLARPVQAGQALRSADLVPRKWFVQGDTVRVHAVGSGFAVSTEGQALTPGLEGQSARIRTESGRVLVGLPVGERQLELRL